MGTQSMVTSHHQADLTLARQCMKGKGSAQRDLYEAYKVGMYGLCMRYMKHAEEAEDVLQEGFIKVFEQLKQYKGEGPLGGWIRRVMVNTCLMKLRSQRRLVFPETSLEYLAEQEHPEQDLLAGDRAEAVIRLIRELPDGYQTVFNMYAIEGYAHHEIAKKLGLAEGTVRSQYVRAKAALKKVLERQMME